MNQDFYLLHNGKARFILKKGETYIGRDSSKCTIVLDHPHCSRVHAVVSLDERGDVAIKDLSGRGTTFLNGRLVEASRIREGDRISFGSDPFETLILHRSAETSQDSNETSHYTRGTLPALEEVSVRKIPSADFSVTLPDRTADEDTGTHCLRIGRALDNEIQLDCPEVSRRHARIDFLDSRSPPIISDLGSRNGTFVNGDLLKGSRQLLPDDCVTLGRFLLRLDGHNVSKQDLAASRIAAYKVSTTFDDNTVLKDVSLALYPREFVGLMGTSGCGKSTLLDALNGRRPASSGSVFINELSLYENFDVFRRSIGYVPQKDVLHDHLSVFSTLKYAARLRLPSNYNAEQIREIVAETIETVGLRDQADTPFKNLSGGQQKRLSLGIELLTKPTFLFLDEPTSPLDPETTENMMDLFRRLADEGRIVVMVTHKFERFESMNHVAILSKGGQLVFFGPPREALDFFECRQPGEIYRKLGERSPDELNRDFRDSRHYQQYVSTRFGEISELQNLGARSLAGGVTSHPGAERDFGIKQFITLTKRYLEIKRRDLRNTLILLAQAPIIALILALITSDTPNDSRTIFIAAVIAIWLGANNSIREVVSETVVYIRERMVNLKIPSYILSKFTVLSGIGFVQCVLFVGILTAFGRFRSTDFFAITLILYLTLLSGVTIGLFCSTIVSSTEKAMSILPLILIPQLLLSGFLKPIDNLYLNLRTNEPATVSDYDAYKNQNANTAKQPHPQQLAGVKVADPIQLSEGLGQIGILSNFITARWTVDALTHQVSRNDVEARRMLATRLFVKEYKYVLENQSDDVTVGAYRSRVHLNLVIIGSFSLLFLSLSMLALKLKDNLKM